MERQAEGRAMLAGWAAAKPTDFYADDDYLRFLLGRRLGPAALARVEARLRQAGADAAGPVSAAAFELDRPEHLPRLQGFTRVGEPSADILVHPTHHEVGRRVWRSGILSVLGEPGQVTLHAATTYLFAQNGEVPHLCSVACTAGLVKAIQRAGTDWMRREWLPRLLDPDYDRRWHAAQFVTEVQGGSDVGANACTARPDPARPGAWRLGGEKWFCSNAAADLFAVSARPDGAPEGTAGVALFVVPRRLDDGRPNGLRMRRLKDKLGTRTLPTAEIEFDGALGWPVGDPAGGFKLLMGVIINTSRLHVAIAGAGAMRRAWIEASHYARLRRAFGRPLGEMPAVRLQLAELRALAAAGLATALFVAALEDRLTLAGTPPEDDPLYRTAINLGKFLCSQDAVLAVHHAIEILGGNGTIEDLSPLPRLWREAPVQESWEGPHNTLMAQVLRDALRSKMHDALAARTQELLLEASAPPLAATRDRALAALDATRASLTRLLRGDPEAAALHVRALAGRLARLFQVALLLDDAAAGEAPAPRWLPAAAELLLRRHVLAGADPWDDPRYGELITRVLT
jgi:hypothetical protein